MVSSLVWASDVAGDGEAEREDKGEHRGEGTTHDDLLEADAERVAAADGCRTRATY